ncbi:MAG: TIGR04255 family protein [Saprospiraceae bacterium]|nr:TIGR04255 family protein [Lewinella sp.]
MEISQKVKPVSSEHSIKEANISLFLANRIPHPDSFHELFDLGFNKLFNQIEMIGASSFKINQGVPDTKTLVKEDNIGFRFLRKDGEDVFRVLQGRNEPDRAYLSFHTLDYKGWQPFREEFTTLFSKIAEYKPSISIKAYSLHYVDQFYWIADEPLDVSVIFERRSKMIPEEFFNSTNAIYSWVKERNVNETIYLDQLNFEFDYTSKEPLVTIRHNAFRLLEEVTEIANLINGEEFITLLNNAHDHNKQTLGEILTNDLQILIKLKKP